MCHIDDIKVSHKDPCEVNYMAEKNSNREMMTVVCYINDLNVSHKDPFEVTKFAKYLLNKYGGK